MLLDDSFPPAKSDDEIAVLVDQMGAELGVFDPRAQKVGRAIAPVRRRPPPLQRPSAPPISLETSARARLHGPSAPPPVPEWALDTVARRPGSRRRAG